MTATAHTRRTCGRTHAGAMPGTAETRPRPRAWRHIARSLGVIPVLCIASMLSQSAPVHARDGVRTVIIDAGHGGDDTGAIGYRGLPEKEVVLRLALQLGEKLEKAGIQVIYTRTTDAFVSLADRTAIANFTDADLFISIHANSSENDAARGAETYFLSLDASDEDALRVALTENEVFKSPGGAGAGSDIVASILGDLIRTEHLLVSSHIASAIQRELGKLSGPSRGVKQAPFIVLSGVNMPAVLIEIGFLTNVLDAGNLRRPSYRGAMAAAIVRAVLDLPVIDRSPTAPAPRTDPTTGDAR